MPRRILFVLKRRSYASTGYYDTASSGLFHSAFFCVQTLLSFGIPAKLVVVIDNNDIDREVSRFKPTDVIIEALWVVPEKFVTLRALHPTVRWIVRLHSEIPFLAQEGIAMEWILKYVAMRHVYVSGNSVRVNHDLQELAKIIGFGHKILYLPNCYTDFPDAISTHMFNGTLNIGCFGAIRPLKNQLLQTIAAIQFCSEKGFDLRFHVNGGRVEWQGESIVRNLHGLFDGLSDQFQLIEHPWLPRHDYLRLIDQMDLGMQCSLSETFNIATADMVSRNVPVVVSDEIAWVSSIFLADPTDSRSIVSRLNRAWMLGRFGAALNQRRLRLFAENSAEIWRSVFQS